MSKNQCLQDAKEQIENALDSTHRALYTTAAEELELAARSLRQADALQEQELASNRQTVVLG